MSVPSSSGFNDEIEVPGIRQQVNDYVNEAHEEGISYKGNENLYVVIIIIINIIIITILF